MKDFFESYLKQIRSNTVLNEEHNLIALTEEIADTFANNGTVWICGNGGSMCSAQHFAEDCVKCIREAIGAPVKCFALGTNNGYITCISNDLGYDNIFSYELSTVLNPETDLVIGLSVSGNSPNVLKAIEYASNAGALTACIVGFSGTGKLAKAVNIPVIVDSGHFGIVEDITMMYLHAISYFLVTKKEYINGLRRNNSR